MGEVLVGFLVAQLMEQMKANPSIKFIQPGMAGPIRTSVVVLVALLNIALAYLEGPEALAKPDVKQAVSLVLQTLSSAVVAHLTYKATFKLPG